MVKENNMWCGTKKEKPEKVEETCMFTPKLLDAVKRGKYLKNEQVTYCQQNCLYNRSKCIAYEKYTLLLQILARGSTLMDAMIAKGIVKDMQEFINKSPYTEHELFKMGIVK